MRGLTLAAAVALLVGGCAHVPTDLPAEHVDRNDARPMARSQVLAFEGCTKLDGLRHFENGLFRVGFLRETLRPEDPIPFELLDRLMSGQAQVTTYRKSDFQAISKHGSLPYHEIVNRYGLSACEEPGGGLFLIVVRRDPERGDKFLGALFEKALSFAECKVTPVAPPRELGSYQDTTEEDLLRHVRRGLCRDYAKGR